MAKDYQLHLKGFVGDYDFDSEYVEYVLGKFANQEVNVLISSFGGYTNTALKIASAFRRHGNVHIHYSGMNASAATIAGMGAKHITIESSAFWLVHNASTFVDVFDQMNAEDLAKHIDDIRKNIDMLETLDEGVAALYASRCNKPASELSALMKEEKWMTAAEALDWGFVDEVVETAPVKIPESVSCALMEAGLPALPKIADAEKESRLESGIRTILAKLGFTKSDKDMDKETKQPEEQPAVEQQAQPAAEQAQEETPAAESNETTGESERIAALESKIQEQAARIAELEKTPGATTSEVREKGGEHSEPGMADAYVSDLNTAKKIFNSLP